MLFADVQSGGMFGFPSGQSASPSSASGGGGAAAGSSAMGSTNLNLAAGGGGGGSSGVGASAAAAAAAQAQYMQAMMQQSQGFPFAQFPAHFGAATFGGAASQMGAQQVRVDRVGGKWVWM